jgi:hypothetical protein
VQVREAAELHLRKEQRAQRWEQSVGCLRVQEPDVAPVDCRVCWEPRTDVVHTLALEFAPQIDAAHVERADGLRRRELPLLQRRAEGIEGRWHRARRLVEQSDEVEVRPPDCGEVEFVDIAVE